MPKFHITKNGDARPCTATERPCPLGGEHFDSMREAAVAAFEMELVSLEVEEEPMSSVLGQPFEGGYENDWLDRTDPEEWKDQFAWLSPDEIRSNSAPWYGDDAAEAESIEQDIQDAQDYLQIVAKKARERGLGHLVPEGF